MNQRIKQVRRLSLLTLLIAVLVLQMQVFAADRSCSVSLPVEVNLTGESAPSGIDFTVKLTANDAASPMPEKDTLVLTGSGKGNIGPITYTRPGTYTYTAVQTKGSAEYVSYDTTVYDLTVFITNDSQGNLVSDVKCKAEGAKDKSPSISYTNSYVPPETETETATETETESATETEAAKTIVTKTVHKSFVTAVKTGDPTAVMTLAGMLCVSAAVIIFAVVYIMKKRKKNE